MKYLSKQKKILIYTIIIVLFITLLFLYSFMIYSFFAKTNFVNQAVQISDKNQKPVFKIKKVLLYSSAGAIDNTEEKSLKDIDISQYSDIAIYLDNTSYIPELTQENTVKSLKISDIQLLYDQPFGIRSLTYKNPLDFAKFKISEAANIYTQQDTKYAPIDYSILYENSENIDYSKPTFYTDCSDPITLSYLNKNISPHYSVPDNVNISLNGSLLKQSNIDLNLLTTAINFKITLTNNLDQIFIYNIKLNLAFTEDSGITNGYLFQGREASGKAYNFFKEI